MYPATIDDAESYFNDLDAVDAPLISGWEDGWGNPCTLDGWGD